MLFSSCKSDSIVYLNFIINSSIVSPLICMSSFSIHRRKYPPSSHLPNIAVYSSIYYVFLIRQKYIILWAYISRVILLSTYLLKTVNMDFIITIRDRKTSFFIDIFGKYFSKTSPNLSIMVINYKILILHTPFCVSFYQYNLITLKRH